MNIKHLILPLIAVLLLLTTESNAQPWPYYGHRYGGVVYRNRPMVSIGIGGVFGGYYPGRVYGYGWGPSVGVNIGVVLPPPGARLRSLPPGSKKRYYGGTTYYYRNNIYYRERENGGYEIAEPPLGASFERLPAGTRKMTINGEVYYERNGNYYMKDVDNEGNPIYILAGKNGEVNTREARRRMIESYGSFEEDDYDSNKSSDENEEVIVRNADKDEESDDAVYYTKPQLGDRFEQLPKNSRVIAVDGKKQYVSPGGVYYKEVTENGNIVYEVVRVK